jgi:RNA polymerase sigma-70 factor (ECF subfamily)
MNLGAALTLDGVMDRPHEDRRQAAHRTVSALFDEVRDPLVRYLVHVGVPKDNVEEAVQAAFLKLFEHLLDGGLSTNLRGWVFRVARNAALNEIRRGRRFVSTDVCSEVDQSRGVLNLHSEGGSDERHDPPFETALGTSSPADHRRRPDQLVLERERNQRLKEALSRLSPVQRECLHLRAAGMKYREIGELVGLPTSTVADYLNRALEQLEEDCDG